MIRRLGPEDVTVARELRLDALASGNQPAEQLYRGHGFTPNGVTEVRERDGAVEIEMEVRVDVAGST